MRSHLGQAIFNEALILPAGAERRRDPVDAVPINLNEAFFCWPRLRIAQAEKQIARGRRDGDAVRAIIGSGGITTGCPSPVSWIGILLQGVAARVRPGNDDAVRTDKGDDQVRQAGSLHDKNQTPESAGRGIIAAGHRAARIRLADGADDLTGRTGAGAAATGDFIPVNRVLLRVNR